MSMLGVYFDEIAKLRYVMYGHHKVKNTKGVHCTYVHLVKLFLGPSRYENNS